MAFLDFFLLLVEGSDFHINCLSFVMGCLALHADMPYSFPSWETSNTIATIPGIRL